MVDKRKLVEALKEVAEQAKAVMMAVMDSELGVNEKVGRNTLVEGKIFQNINIGVDGLELVEVLVNDYIQYIESGRRPGSFPPVSVIAKWAAEKHITTDNRVVWAICQSIYKEGIAARPLIDVRGGFWERVERDWDEWFKGVYDVLFEELDKQFNKKVE